MADDLDAELLALAGDSSDEEASPPAKERVQSRSRSSSPQSPDASAMGRKGTARTVKRGRKSRRNDDEEDGELYVLFATRVCDAAFCGHHYDSQTRLI